MTTWLIPEKALEHATMPVTDENLRLLRVLGHKKKIRWTKFLGQIQYDQDSIDQYREQNARGNRCAASHISKNTPIDQENSYLPAGTSSISTEQEVSASLRGIELAQKTRKPKSRSPNSSLSAKGQNRESQASL